MSIYRWKNEDFKFDKILDELLAEESRLEVKYKDEDKVFLNSERERRTQTSRSASRARSSRKYCSYCQREGHSLEECWSRDRARLPRPKNPQRKYNKSPNKRTYKAKNIIVNNSQVYNASPTSWLYDTGANAHFCANKALFETYHPTDNTQVAIAVDNIKYKIDGTGTVHLDFESGKSITISNVMYARNMSRNLLSGPQLDKEGYGAVVKGGKVVIRDRRGDYISTAKIRKNGLYYLFPNQKINKKAGSASVGILKNSAPKTTETNEPKHRAAYVDSEKKYKVGKIAKRPRKRTNKEINLTKEIKNGDRVSNNDYRKEKEKSSSQTKRQRLKKKGEGAKKAK